jgi:hypothetical protein
MNSTIGGVLVDRRGLWQSMDTAPHDREVLFWLRPKTADEAWHDSSGNPVLTEREPHIQRCKFKCWGSLWTATHWMEPWKPSPPDQTPAGVDLPDGGQRG